MQDALDTYRKKRDPARTTEPFGAEQSRSIETRAGRFVVHLHAATRRHYDLRLEVGGVLKSFAVPRGPSLDPKDKRLAVNTEDHPLEYLAFEDVIPEGNYGAGAMIVWDTGSVRYLEYSAEASLKNGKIDFVLSGHKLRGHFGLIHTGARPSAEAKNEWLLVKKPDGFASEQDLLAAEPYSVLSSLTVDDLAGKHELAQALEARVKDAGGRQRAFDAASIVPMLCKDEEQTRLVDKKRVYELKLDGVRIIADRQGDGAALRYRSGGLATQSYPEIVRAVRELPAQRVVLDGEIVTFDESGRPSFERLLRRIAARRAGDIEQAATETPVVYIVFDLLALGGFDLSELPLVTRKRLLFELIRGRGFLRTMDHFEGDGRPLFELCREQRLEGVVGKRGDSPYRPGPKRSDDWIKIKCTRDDDFVVVGWATEKESKHALGSISIASYSGDRLILRGKVGSGLDRRTAASLEQRLAELETAEPSAEGEHERPRGVQHHVRPELVITVRYTGWTDTGMLRAPVFSGLRADKSPRDCSAAPPKRIEDEARTASRAPAASFHGKVQISNASKVFWPEEGFTKGDLCSYYAKVAPALLPLLAERPVVLVRYPDGIRGKSFFQWNPPRGLPSWLPTLELTDEEGKTRHGFLIRDVDALVYLANLGAIPLHVLAWRKRDPGACDFVTIDFDIGQRLLHDAIVVALSLRELLDEIGLEGYPKTSGQKGLHVLIPVGPHVGFDAAKLLVELLGRLLVARHPELATLERRVEKRGPRVYVDTGQTGESRTIVAPYSVRAYPGATVSTPLRWDEVHGALDPRRFDMQSVPERLASGVEPMADILEVRPDIASAVAKLGRWVR